MARCEDWPACGHELGCCPDFDAETGKQLNMKCTCGATLPVNSRYSICNSCMNRDEDCDGPDYSTDELNYGGLYDQDEYGYGEDY